jgi:hypothetical protein
MRTQARIIKQFIFPLTLIFALFLSCSNFTDTENSTLSNSNEDFEESKVNDKFSNKFNGQFDSLILSSQIRNKYRFQDTIYPDSSLKSILLRIAEEYDSLNYDYALNKNSIINQPSISIDTTTYYVVDDIIINRNDIDTELMKNRDRIVFNKISADRSIREIRLLAELFTDLSNYPVSSSTPATIPIDFSFQEIANFWQSESIRYSISNSNLSEYEYKELNSAFLEASRHWAFYTALNFEQSDDANEINLEIVYVNGLDFSHAECSMLTGEYARTESGSGKGKIRRILIFPQFFSPHPFSRAGILRHEIGHLLGFRHTCLHPKAPKNLKCSETNQSVLLTTLASLPYDSTSVMKGPNEACYFNDYELLISEADRKVINLIYQ